MFRPIPSLASHQANGSYAELVGILGHLPHAYWEIRELKTRSRSLCGAPIDMWLCSPGLRKPSDRPVLTAALCCLMFYLFELMANASGFSAANQATQCLFRDGQ